MLLKMHVMELSRNSIAGEHGILVLQEEIRTTETVLDVVDATCHDSALNGSMIHPLKFPNTLTDEEELKKITECAEAIVQLEKIAREDNNAKRRKTSSDCNITVYEDVENSASSEQICNLQSNSKENKLTCEYCQKKFTKLGNKNIHLRNMHKIKVMRQKNETNILCLECNIRFAYVRLLRKHLQNHHMYTMSMEELSFPDINAFKTWKSEIERLTLSSYTRKNGSRKTSAGRAHFFTCHRSGKFRELKVMEQRKRMPRTYGTCKLGIACTAAVTCIETQHGVQVKYYPYHYGHGKETTLITLTEEEEKAIADSASKGVTYENVVIEMQESQSALDTFQLDVLRKRDSRLIEKAYEGEDFNFEFSEVESIDRWVSSCGKMENSPILFYEKDVCKKKFRKVKMGDSKDILLILMSESQKHILLTSPKQVICLDVLIRSKGVRCYLISLLIIDETGAPFPAAFCISSKVDKKVMSLFFSSIVKRTGPLCAEYFMSEPESAYHKAWRDVMNDNSKWLWNMWNVERRLRCQVILLPVDTSKRTQLFKTIKKLLECHNQVVFSHMYDDLMKNLSEDRSCQKLAIMMKKKYCKTRELWAYCYRKDISFATNIKLEMIHSILKYCCHVGRNRRLDTFLFVLLKLLREKIFQRLSCHSDKIDVGLATNIIDGYHKLGLEIPPEYITDVSDKIWLVLTDSEDEHFYVTLEHESCPEDCSLKCSECKICVHAYSCTCTGNLINADFCIHIHAVVWNFVPPPSPAAVAQENDLDELGVVPGGVDNLGLLHQVLEASHEVFEKVRDAEKDVKEDSLHAMLKRLRECINIWDGKNAEVPPS